MSKEFLLVRTKSCFGGFVSHAFCGEFDPNFSGSGIALRNPVRVCEITQTVAAKNEKGEVIRDDKGQPVPAISIDNLVFQDGIMSDVVVHESDISATAKITQDTSPTLYRSITDTLAKSRMKKMGLVSPDGGATQIPRV